MRSESEMAGMTCPVDGAALAMSDRQGVEIDYCPKCRGVWLDRGELDKIIERSEAASAPAVQAAPQAAPQPSYAPQPGYAPPQHQQPWGYGKPHYKRKKSFLEELFD